MSTMDRGEPKLIFPGLAEFYATVSDLWYPMIRITVGAILLVHGWGKIKTGITALAVGVLMAFDENDSRAKVWLARFIQGLSELGWTDGRNLRMDVRWAGTQHAICWRARDDSNVRPLPQELSRTF